ncbi:hypothetical protein [Brevibacterium aurantiacum]|uniref:Uncharacterized protein n=1 Tax=Brevibacterium aurantiacum TaxID=273384 RepID=A0A3Q9NQQ8_BREAU|nr:hypothetical protein [Brevibacterium aurantiacum]AZT92942.1 hypothetical protein CXR23_07140 [Brevibacterium aurantiacum]
MKSSRSGSLIDSIRYAQSTLGFDVVGVGVFYHSILSRLTATGSKTNIVKVLDELDSEVVHRNTFRNCLTPATGATNNLVDDPRRHCSIADRGTRWNLIFLQQRSRATDRRQNSHALESQQHCPGLFAHCHRPAINALDLAACDILVYFGLMFVLIVPLVRLRSHTLLTIGTAMIIVLPVLRYLLH